MVSLHSNDINFDEVEKQGIKAIENDSRYWRENDAKFRAVGQKVASYEEFRDIVLASHLKPLDKGEKMDFSSSKRSAVWNVAAGKYIDDPNISSVDTFLESVEAPKTCAEFCKYWKRQKSPHQRYNYIISQPLETIENIFIKEIPAGLITEIVDCFNYAYGDGTNLWTDSTTAYVLGVLGAIAKSSRFSISLMFLSNEDKVAISTLLQNLKISCCSNDTLTIAISDITKKFTSM